MITAQWINIEDVINRIRSWFKLYNEQGLIEEDDSIQWIVDTIRDIGVPQVFDNVPIIVVIDDYQGQLPDFIQNITSPVYRMKDTTSLDTNITNIGITNITTNQFKFFIPNIDAKKILSISSIMFYGGSQIKLFADQPNLYSADECTDSFIINSRSIKTSFKTGYVYFEYSGMRLDNNNLPMVLDDYDILECIRARVFYELCRQKMYEREDGWQSTFEESKRDYFSKVEKARNVLQMDSPSDALLNVYENKHRYDRFALKTRYGTRRN